MDRTSGNAGLNPGKEDHVLFQDHIQRRGPKVYLCYRSPTVVGVLLAATLLCTGCAPATWNYRPTDVGLRTPITAPTRLSVRVDGAPSQAEADELAAGIGQDLQTNAFPNTVTESPVLDVSVDVRVGARTGFPYGCLSGGFALYGVPLGKHYGRAEVTAFVADATGTRLARYTAVNEQGALYGVVLGVPYGCWHGEDQIPAATAAAIDDIKQDIARDRSRLARAVLRAPTQPIDTAAADPHVRPSPSLPAPGIIQLSDSVGQSAPARVPPAPAWLWAPEAVGGVVGGAFAGFVGFFGGVAANGIGDLMGRFVGGPASDGWDTPVGMALICGALGGSAGVWSVGRIARQGGGFWPALLGSGAGLAVYGATLAITGQRLDDPTEEDAAILAAAVIPIAIGATVGYNLGRPRKKQITQFYELGHPSVGLRTVRNQWGGSEAALDIRLVSAKVRF